MKLGTLAAASPACGDGSIYAVLLARDNGMNAGRVVALDARNGRTRWSRKLPSRAESSPLIDHGRVYFGSDDGTVYSLNARDGSLRALLDEQHGEATLTDRGHWPPRDLVGCNAHCRIRYGEDRLVQHQNEDHR